MGCDGGTIPRRDELVRMKKKPEQVDKNFELNAKWFHCAISQESLHPPIVSCELGNLYNKESVLEFLLDKANATSDIAKHIRSLKDVKELKLTENPAFETQLSKGEKADAYQDFQASRYICPVVGIEMNGRYKFCFLWKCGCVFSERALKEVKSSFCHKCGQSFSDEDVVIINGSEEEFETMKSKMLERRQKAKLEKKSKKSKVTATITSETSSSAPGPSMSQAEKVFKHPGTSESEIPTKKARIDSVPQVNGAASSSKTASTSSSKVGSTSSSKTEKTKSKGKDPKVNMKIPELSKYKTVAEDPNASKVYKSLFASGHEKRPERLKSNWVAYHAYGGYHI